ncbi:MAG: DUF2723 domain-containing protein [Bacteroidales bacterium]|nr:DUF2723 domain-containing protein [Candidatus Cryptobacteroides aphodequi]
MENSRFKLWNRVCAAVAFVVSAVTYLCTIEPTASFWDCGEFIASSYKLEVGHPPGNPVFQIIARIFTMFGDNMHAAILVNAMSALCAALTIFFLYLTIVWLAKRLVKRDAEGNFSTAGAISIFGAGLVGSLACTFSDTFWFSAVEGEVYAMSSLFTAVVFWAMTRWYDTADEPRSGRWIVLIAFLMGLSIGVHLLNLLAIPALVFIYYYRKRENGRFTFGELVKVFLVGVAILALILFVIIPWLPKLAAYFDLFFVNVLHLPYNTGAAFFMVAVLGLCFLGLFKTLDKGKVFWNTSLLCLTSIIVGFSVFSIDVIRSAAKTPTNEYQPDNAFTLVRYLSREQYGKTPIVYGQYFDAPYELKTTRYWAPLPDKKGRPHYQKVDGPVEAVYKPSGKMLFPRMWSSSPDGRFEEFYQSYTGGKGTRVPGARYRKPSGAANLTYFFDYQLGWMYWRYFMWNFVGRQNEIHSPVPGNAFHGNWESGIKPLDALRLGDQSEAPSILGKNKGKNHYFFLPLLLGLLGLCFQFGRDKRGSWLTFLMFFMTGIAIVVYLNQPPYQVRERDYAYAGSFYFFCVWIGLGVIAVAEKVTEWFKGKHGVQVALASGVLLLGVPALMGAQNWDDHDRSNRRTAVEMAGNYLNSVGPDGILITHGDNDTFPLWYAQEVEETRTDVRICNTSLLGTDWHIDQMLYAVNESAPLELTIPHTQYLYGNNEYIPIVDKGAMSIADAVAVFRNQKEKVGLSSGRKVDYWPSRTMTIPVDKANVLASGLVPERFADRIPDTITFTMSPDKDFLTKPELFFFDLMASYDWSRPVHMLNMGGEINVGQKDFLEFVGYSYRLVPIKNKISGMNIGYCDTDGLYNKMTSVYSWDNLARKDYLVDYQNYYTFLGVMNVRQMFLTCANAFLKEGRRAEALEMLEKGIEASSSLPLETIPIGFTSNDYVVIGMIQLLYKLGAADKARELGTTLANELITSARFYYRFYGWSGDCFEDTVQYSYYLADEMRKGGDTDIAGWISETMDSFFAKEEK